MATISNSTVRITVDPGKSDDENTNIEVSEENQCEKTIKEKSNSPEATKSEKENDRNSVAETCRDTASRLLLRPSALARDISHSKLFSWSTSSFPPLHNSNSNKFACPDASTDSLFNIPSSSDKVESIPKLTTPKIPPVAVTLSNPNYVFGENIADRVAEKVETVSNGTSSMLFSTVAKASVENKNETKDGEGDNKETSSLLEDAARCQEQRAAKRKYDEVQVTTGEEDEKNVLQITVKLFAFEGGSWVERGRGTLRLNDFGNSGARIVVRTFGSLRVVLNTKIWAGMELSRASERSLRTTAMDTTGTVKIFLIQANPADVTMLYNCMDTRVKRCQVQENADLAASGVKDELKNEAEDESPRSPKLAALDATS